MNQLVVQPLAGFSEVLIGFAIAIFIIIIAFQFRRLVTPTLSNFYRKYLADMYIAARIRQRADKEQLDLHAEETQYKIFTRKMKMKNRKELDDKIEEQLNAEIEKEMQDLEDADEKDKDKPKASK